MTTNRTVIVEPVPKQGAHGDRATLQTPYFDYNVHLAPDGVDASDDTLLHTISGYDNWQTHVRDRNAVKRQAFDYANRLSALHGGGGAYIVLTESTPSTKRKAALAKLTAEDKRLLGLDQT